VDVCSKFIYFSPKPSNGIYCKKKMPPVLVNKLKKIKQSIFTRRIKGLGSTRESSYYIYIVLPKFFKQIVTSILAFNGHVLHNMT